MVRRYHSHPMNTHFLLIESGAAVVVAVLCLLIFAGVSFASYQGDAGHDGDDHDSGKPGGDGH